MLLEEKTQTYKLVSHLGCEEVVDECYVQERRG